VDRVPSETGLITSISWDRSFPWENIWENSPVDLGFHREHDHKPVDLDNFMKKMFDSAFSFLFLVFFFMLGEASNLWKPQDLLQQPTLHHSRYRTGMVGRRYPSPNYLQYTLPADTVLQLRKT
jgi:hypothetical protein